MKNMNKKQELKQLTKLDKVLALTLWSLWTVLLIAGTITAISPYWLLKITKDNRKEEASDYIKTAKELCRERDYSTALLCLQQVDRIYPNMPEALINTGYIYKNIGNYDKAVEYYIKGVQADSTCKKSVYCNLTDIYLLKKDIKKAQYYAELAWNNDLTIFDRFFKKSILLMNNGLWEDAESLLRKIDVSYNNINSQIEDLLGRTKEKIANNDYSSNANYEKCLKNIDTVNNRYDLDLLLKLNRKSSFLSKVYNKIGFCLAQKNNFVEAKQYFIKSRNCDINNLDAADNLNYINNTIKTRLNN